MIDVGRRRRTVPAAPGRSRRRRRRLGRSLARRPRRPLRAVPRAAGRRARRAGRPRRLAGESPSPRRSSSTRSALSLVDDGGQPGRDRRARAAAGVRPGPPAVPRQGLARGGRRPADRAAAVGRRASPCCSCSAGAGCSAAPLDAPRHRDPVHDDRGRPRPDVRVGAVLHPLRAGRDRRRRPRPRGRRPGRRRVGAAAVPRRSPCRSPAPPSPPGW